MVLFVSGARPLKVFGRTGAMNERRASDMSECYLLLYRMRCLFYRI